MKNFYLSILFLMAIASAISSCKVHNVRGEQGQNKLEQLANWMTGSFTSEEQSIVDSNFFNIHLEMVRIWPERNDGIWLYVEQAASWALDKPYRQRVYRLTKTDGKGEYESAVYTFEDPLRFAGAYSDEIPLKHLTVDSLSLKSGCSIFLKYVDSEFTGSTLNQDCKSELRGATFATSEVNIREKVLTSWDRGFDKNSKQVWGAVTGPYIFRKVN